MKSKKTLIGIIILCILIITIISIIFLTNNNQEQPSKETKPTQDELKYNVKEDITKDKLINNILFSDIECTFDGNTSLLTYKITNQGTEAISLDEYEITIKDKNNNILAIISPNIIKKIKPNETIETGNAIDIDLTQAYKIELTLINK